MPHISPGNTKIGKTPNISLPPIVTCAKSVGCAKDCYAIKFFKMYKGARNAWEENLHEYIHDPDGYFGGIRSYLAKKPVEYFRFHVSGDIPDKAYLARVVELATEFSGTKFMIFTKRYEWAADLADRFPANLRVNLSSWPNMEFQNPAGLPVSWIHDPKNLDGRIPPKAFKCHGSCAKCRVCWNAKSMKHGVVFDKH